MSVYSNLSSSTPDEVTAYVAALLGLLGDRDPVDVLRRTPDAIDRFLGAVPAAVVTTPERPGKWSIRDVVQHLARQDDEEHIVQIACARGDDVKLDVVFNEQVRHRHRRRRGDSGMNRPVVVVT